MSSLSAFGRLVLGSAIILLPASISAQCGSTTIYDTGGAGGNYANFQNYTVTYCPPVAGQAVVITFSSFNTEAGWDFLRIHNGPTNGSTQLGIFSGTTNPGTFTSTDPSGCLTIWFTSDGSITAPGWVATVTCVPLGPPPSVCGSVVYDTGGPGGSYTNNQNYTVTYCPDLPGEVVTINFNSFSVEPAGFFGPYDYLSIFNGPNNGSAQMGTWTGTNSPGSITSTHPSGCLTIQFVSDGSVTYPGWAANITCAPPPPPPAGDCVYVLTLQDSFGDGWGASNVGVSINGGPYQYYSVGAFTNQILIGVNVGDLVVLSYSNAGPWQGENSFTLGLSSGGTLFASGTPPAPGIVYAGAVDCIPPPAPPEDCIGGITLCSNQSISNNTNNTGNIVDLTTFTAGCLSSAERQGTWYNFSPSTSGTLAFTINPVNPFDDYDFAIWGPYPEGSNTATICPPAGTPLRCSWAAPSGDTGLNFTATDLTEGAGGDKWVRYLDVLEGQVYLLYISNFSQSGLAFNLNFNPASTASLDCTLLPMDFIALQATPVDRVVELDWSTYSESGTDRFIIERSIDGVSFLPLDAVPAQGESHNRTDYRFVDGAPIQGINFYRLAMLDLDGDSRNSNVVTANFGSADPVLVPNPVIGQAVLHLGSNLPEHALLRITDASGRLVRERALPSGSQHVLDLQGLGQGAYVIALYAADGAPLGHSRFIKQ